MPHYLCSKPLKAVPFATFEEGNQRILALRPQPQKPVFKTKRAGAPDSVPAEENAGSRQIYRKGARYPFYHNAE